MDFSSQLIAVSPSGKLTASLLAVPDPNGGKEKKFYARIFNNVKQVEVNLIDLGAAKKHGTVHLSNIFSALRWSNDESRLLYIAERLNKPSAYFDADIEWGDEEKMAKANLGEKFKLEESWGEQTEGCKQPAICILNLADDVEDTTRIQVLDSVPVDISPMAVSYNQHHNYVVMDRQNTPLLLSGGLESQ